MILDRHIELHPKCLKAQVNYYENCINDNPDYIFADSHQLGRDYESSCSACFFDATLAYEATLS